MRYLSAVALLFGALVAGCSDDVRTIEVGIEHSSFIPERIEVQPGETVRFVIHNGDPIDHEFIVGDEVVQSRHEEGTETRHGEKRGEVSIAAGETAETTYTFPSSGKLIVGCHLPQHYDYGMRGTIVIGT